jgi:sensor histidine kinase YesM
VKPIQQLMSGNKLTRHLLFCLGVLLLLSLGLYFLYVSGFHFELLPAFANCLFFLLCIYSGRWLCQAFYLRNLISFFIVFSLSAFIVLGFLEYILVKYVFHHPYAGFLELFRGNMTFLLAGVVLGMLLELISASMRKELQDAQIKAKQKESEFSLLQSQLSPHFLFNVLNNLYGISIEDHHRIPALLLKLSNLLRYSIYSTKKTLVPLKDELEYIRNYIEFEQIRTSDRLNLAMHIEQVSSPGIQIAPEVLIVFVENAFKHSKNTLSQEIDIKISLKINDNFICMEVSNSYQQDKSGHQLLDDNSGLGLPNTIKRLDLLYGDDYDLNQYTENNLYYVKLRLKING